MRTFTDEVQLCHKKLHSMVEDNIMRDTNGAKRCRACNNHRLKLYMRKVRENKLKEKEKVMT